MKNWKSYFAIIYSYRYLILILFFFPAVIMLFNLYNRTPQNSIQLSEGWYLESNYTYKNIDNLPFYISGQYNEFKPGEYKFTCIFTADKTVIDPLLFIPFISGNGLKISVDNEINVISGDIKEGNASIWNKAHVYYLFKDLQPGHHKLEITIFGLYDAGILTTPFIQSRSSGLLRKIILYMTNQYIIDLLSGIILLLAVIFIITGIKSHDNYQINIYLGLLQLFLYMYIKDLSYIDSLIIDYIIFKKAVTCAIYISVIFLLLLVNRLFLLKTNKIDIAAIILNILIILIIIFIPENMSELRRIYNITSLSIIFIFIYIFIRTALLKQKSRQAKMMLTAIIFVFIFSTHDILLRFFAIGSVYFTHYGIMGAVIFITAIVLINISETHAAVIHEKKQSSEFQQISMTDSLTGAYNRRMLTVLNKTVKQEYSVIMADMNKFKIINDTYGHQTGDRVLIETVSIIKKTIRHSDYLIRYGGDEFVLILPECSEKAGRELLERISEKSEGKIYNEDDKTEISFSFSMGFYSASDNEPILRSIKKADEELYEIKHSR